ncbi:MAG: hypothetical protein KAS39_04985, partial [Actinomycetia bacterium]|nr:hypothetical protein [Actinomycetes bacterium]
MKKGRNLTFLIVLLIFALCLPAEASLDEEIMKPIKEVIKEDIKDLNWTSVSEGQFDYYYYKGDIKDIYLVRRAFQNAFPKIKSYLRSNFPDKIKVLIFPGEESLRKYFKKPLQDKDLSGLSFPEDLIMMIPLTGNDIPSDFIAVHELTHLIFRKTLLPYEPSLWIDEGIASYFGVHHIISPYRVVLPSYLNETALTTDFISL